MLPGGCFNGKIALVTGGGTGLGLAIAHKLSELGAVVAISSRNSEVLEQTADKISQLTRNSVYAIPADVRDPSSVANAVDDLVSLKGVPTIIVNNAAGNFVSPFERLNSKGFSTIVDIVLNGTANVTLDVGKRLIRERKSGVFLNISTTYADTGSGYVVPSAAAKAGVSALVKSLAVEWGKYGIRVVGIAPGPIDTKGAMSRLDPTGRFRERLISNNPTGRVGEKEELANLASYMVSDYANWMTGEIVRLDGGETCFNSGEFNFLSEVTNDEWDVMESIIRKTNKQGS